MSARRLSILFEGLPPEAAIWRRDMLPPLEEFAALQIERMELWSNALLEALCHKPKISVPGQLTIPRPGQEEAPPKNVVSIAEYAALIGEQ